MVRCIPQAHQPFLEEMLESSCRKTKVEGKLLGLGGTQLWGPALQPSWFLCGSRLQTLYEKENILNVVVCTCLPSKIGFLGGQGR